MSDHKQPKRGKSTQAIHGRKDPIFRSAVYPIFQTSAFGVEETRDWQRYIDGDPEFFVYTRTSNPTIRNAEEKLAALENMDDAVLFSSGMAAISAVLLTYLKGGDTVVASRRLYGATYQFLRDFAPEYGITAHFLDDDELYQLDQLYPDTKLVYFETPANPTASCVSIEKIVKGAQNIGALTVIDNTFASPINQNPADFGVDIVLHSVTKYIGGHSDLMGGVAMASVDHIKHIRKTMKLLGGNTNPNIAFLIDRSIKTLKPRVEIHNRNAMALAEFFDAESKVERVHYPGLGTSPYHDIAKQQMCGFGGMLAIELRDLTAAETFCDSLQVALNATSLGSVETLVSIPVWSSHINMSDEELAGAQVTRGMVRISAGLEDIDDLVNDFEQALGKA
jgi:cystathionine beta-lyase/cystathionine gamma-synthase